MKENTILEAQSYDLSTLNSDIDINGINVYKSNSKINSLNYCGKINTLGIIESSTINEIFSKKLENFKGKASIGKTYVSGKYIKKNLHIYSNKAETLDGLYRICYVKGYGNELHVSEFGRSSDRYSGYFKILEENLIKEDFSISNGIYIINEKNIDKFIEILNLIIDLEEKNELFLSAISKNIKIKDNIFSTVYWKKMDYFVSNRISKKEEAIDFLINNIKKMKTKDELNDIKNIISEVLNLIISLEKLAKH